MPMRVIAIKALKEFWKKHPDSEQPLKSWYYETKKANWQNPEDVTRLYRKASILRNNRIVFNIKGNSYRLITAINYNFKIVYIRFIGTHQEYDKINAEEI